MSIWVEPDTRLIVQGITGKQGMFHATRMIEYGTKLVGGVTPGKGGSRVELSGTSVPVFDTIEEAIHETGECHLCPTSICG